MPWVFIYSDLGPQALTATLSGAPFVSLPASLPKYRIAFKGKSRKWGGAVATLEKKSKAWVYGSIHLLPPDDIKKLDKYYSYFEKIEVPIFIDATQDKVKAQTYIIKDAPYGEPSDEYIKALLKHLKFFWGQQGAGKPKLETFGITTGITPTVKKSKLETVAPMKAEDPIKKARKPRRRTAKS
jgi:AIG2-like family